MLLKNTLWLVRVLVHTLRLQSFSNGSGEEADGGPLKQNISAWRACQTLLIILTVRRRFDWPGANIMNYYWASNGRGSGVEPQGILHIQRKLPVLQRLFLVLSWLSLSVILRMRVVRPPAPLKHRDQSENRSRLEIEVGMIIVVDVRNFWDLLEC